MKGDNHLLSRRDAMIMCGGLSASLVIPELAAAEAQKPVLVRPIPHGHGESLPVIGVGTAGVFNVGTSAQDRTGQSEVVRALLAGLNALKAQGLCRYTGITTTYKGAYAATEAILKRASPDFLEVDYAIDNLAAGRGRLPDAKQRARMVEYVVSLG